MHAENAFVDASYERHRVERKLEALVQRARVSEELFVDFVQKWICTNTFRLEENSTKVKSFIYGAWQHRSVTYYYVWCTY